MPEKNFYQILGVSRLATAEQIKRRYRHLARIHHPDVADDKQRSNQIFIEISTAYQTLIDPDKRLVYDASLDKDFLDYQNRVYSKTESKSRNSRIYETSINDQKARIDYVAEARKKIAEAESAFVSNQLKKAAAACNTAIRMDKMNPKSYVILGDIYKIQGFNEQAISMYTVALQLDPKNASVQTKLNRVSRNMADQYGYDLVEKHSLYRLIAIMFCWFFILFLLLYIRYSPGEPISVLSQNFKFIGSWSINLIISMFLVGCSFGLVLSLDNKINPIDDELVFQGVKGSGSPPLTYPVGLMMLIFNFFNFYLAAFIYLIIALIQDSISKSIFTVLMIVFISVIACEIAYAPSNSHILVFGGNIIFVGLLTGWTFGDMFRPTW